MRVQPVASDCTNFKNIPVGSFFKFTSPSDFSKNNKPLEINIKIDAIGSIFFKTEEIETEQSKHFYYNAVNIITGELYYFFDNDVGMVYSDDDIIFNFNVSAISLFNPISVEKKNRKINISPKEKPISFGSIYTGNIFSIADEDYNENKNYFDFFSTFFYIKIPMITAKIYNNYNLNIFSAFNFNAVDICTGSYVFVQADTQVINFNSDCFLTFKN